ncbi:hypothetical protein [Nonomuraea basaltis]|uniref:hypothetical protein n=1 Tax=Nonomuraea basaltis TaxID=2495887 RepID=UPI00110C5BDE|nr:hypothetical protein [Nonomuraea basaltis]TMR95615.1 hypothetical protein EJK15_27410 [Nonomuraea basaltis]
MIKGHHIDLSDPKNRLAHGLVAQTLLAALMVAIANEFILLAWRQTHDRPNPRPRTPPHPMDKIRTWNRRQVRQGGRCS